MIDHKKWRQGVEVAGVREDKVLGVAIIWVDIPKSINQDNLEASIT